MKKPKFTEGLMFVKNPKIHKIADDVFTIGLIMISVGSLVKIILTDNRYITSTDGSCKEIFEVVFNPSKTIFVREVKEGAE